MNIIIVDDEKVIRNGLSFIISQFNREDRVIGLFASGHEALAFCSSSGTEVDLVITDIRMPDMNGLELIERMKRKHQHIQVIVISGYNDFEYARTALRLGAVDYILKPADKSELKKVLEKAKGRLTENILNVESNRSVIVDNLINGLFRGDPGCASEARSYLEKAFGISDTCVYIGAGVVVDNLPDKTMSQADLSLFQYFIRKLAEETLFENPATVPNGLVVQDKSGIVVIIFVIDAQSSDMKLIYTGLQTLLSNAIRHIDYPITIGISQAASSIYDFPVLYDQIQTAMKYRMTAGTRKIIEYGIVRQGQGAVQPALNFSLFHDVISALRSGDASLVRLSLMAFIDEICKTSVSPEQVNGLLMKLFYQISDYMDELGMRTQETGRIASSKIKLTLEQCTTRELLEKTISDLLMTIVDDIQVHRTSSKPKFILQAIDYIHANFANDITLIEVADYVNMYPTYFSEQFKHYMEVTFIEYLTRHRVHQAKKLLSETDIPVYLLCEQVGYATPAHFTKVFKKATGVTPSRYREDTTSQLPFFQSHTAISQEELVIKRASTNE